MWTCKLSYQDSATITLHNLFICSEGKKMVSPSKTNQPTNEELKGLHGGVRVSLTGWLSSSVKPLMKPVSHSASEFDRMMIPVFVCVVYHLCPLFWHFSTIQQSCFINVAWILKPTSVLFLHPIDGFTWNCVFFFSYWTCFEWQNTVTWIIQARTLCLLVCLPHSYYIY